MTAAELVQYWKIQTSWKLTFKKTPLPKYFRGCGWNSEWMLKGWKPLIYLAFWENPSTFKMVHIFNSNKKEKIYSKKKYIVRKNLYSEECTFNLECWRKSRKPWCCVPMTSFNMILERIRNRCFWYICDAGNLWKWRGFSIVEQMEQILYYLNLKYKKIYKKVILRENSKNICSICSMPWKALIFQCFLPEQMCERMCDT